MTRFGCILSVALITAGLVVIADVGITLAYREPLSSIYSSIRQDEAEDQLSELEARYPTPSDRRAIADLRGSKRIAALARRFGAKVSTGEPIGRIAAHAMNGLDMVLIQGTDTSSLEKGPGHYPETPFPGQGGTVGVAGHRTTYLAPFRHIDSMKPGDRISLEMPYARFLYRVQRTKVVDPGDVGVVKPVGYERLVLSACNPLYSAEQRFIVFARLVAERPAAGIAGD